MAWLYRILSAVAPVWWRSPALLSCLHSARHVLNFSFIVFTTEIVIIFIYYYILCAEIRINEINKLPSFTVAVGCNRPAFNCWVARLNPELSHWRALTSKITCSALLLVAAVLACSIPPKGAPKGPAFVLATSHTHSHNATTKFNFANISLCSRSKSVSSGSSGAKNVNGWSSIVGFTSGKRFWKLPASINLM